MIQPIHVVARRLRNGVNCYGDTGSVSVVVVVVVIAVVTYAESNRFCDQNRVTHEGFG